MLVPYSSCVCAATDYGDTINWNLKCAEYYHICAQIRLQLAMTLCYISSTRFLANRDYVTLANGMANPSVVCDVRAPQARSQTTLIGGD